MAAYGSRNEDIALVSVKNKHNALAHPAAQVAARLTVKDILDSDVVAWPVHRLMVSPISDGAAAVVLASEQVARRLSDRPIWIQGVGWCLDTSYWGNRDLAYPRYVEKAAWMAYEMAGVTEPRKQIHVAEPYDPFAYKELHHLEGLQLADRGQAPEDLARSPRSRGRRRLHMSRCGAMRSTKKSSAGKWARLRGHQDWSMRGTQGSPSADFWTGCGKARSTAYAAGDAVAPSPHPARSVNSTSNRWMNGSSCSTPARSTPSPSAT